MVRSWLVALSAALGGFAFGDVVPLVDFSAINIPVTPFSNMASGYQATNPGFRAVIRSMGGDFIAGGPITMDAVIKGTNEDASQGSAYAQLVLRVDMAEAYPGVSSGVMSGKFKGLLSICMAEDADGSIQGTQCRNLKGNIHEERPFQWIDKPIDFTVSNGNITITKYYGNTGEGGTSQQLSLAVFHPAYGFAAPGKAYKDYQSPLVLDLDHNGRLDLVNVWDDTTRVRFDLNGSGEKIRTGWVKPTDGILFWDNGTGCAQSGAQFFGEFTKSANGQATYENGFKALAAQLDKKGSGKILARHFPNLKIWQDKSQDGVCQKGEVIAASRLVKEISLSYETHENVALNEDNEVRLTGNYLGRDGKRHLIGDVWFKQRRNAVANR